MTGHGNRGKEVQVGGGFRITMPEKEQDEGMKLQKTEPAM